MTATHHCVVSPQQLQGRDEDEHDEREGQVYEEALLGMADRP